MRNTERGDRPGSGKSALTALTTATKNITEFTAKTNKSFNNSSMPTHHLD